MSTEPQFLSFKGLKQYSPDDGWGQVNALLQSHARAAAAPAPSEAPPAPQYNYAPEKVPTLTETQDPMQAQNTASPLFDPLISELFDQLRVAPSDELTQTWRTIAAEVNLLTQRMALQRELQERARKLEIDLVDLRSSIMSHLKDVQNVADQQLTSARLRSEVSALAQTKLAAKLNQRR
ncbi:MAG: hypothetical protein WCL41_01760 [Betaproteobacteria bacterium]|jgi:hypothetical protein